MFIWATLRAWPVLGERPTPRSIMALVLGVASVVVLMAPSAGPTPNKLPGIGLALAAAILFGYGAVTARRPLPLPPLVLTAWQVALGCLPMVLLSVMLEYPQVTRLSLPAGLGLAYMTIGPMAACYLTWFAALRCLPTSVAATGMLLVPIVGTLAAVPLLGETLGARQILAFALTLTGVGLALRQRAKPR